MNFICSLFGHSLYVVHYCSKTSQKLSCARCKRDFGINHDARVFIPWTPDLNVSDCNHH